MKQVKISPLQLTKARTNKLFSDPTNKKKQRKIYKKTKVA